MSPLSDLYIPDDVCAAEAHARCSHLGIGAHADDLEFMAYHGISACYQQPCHWFGGIVCTAGNRPLPGNEPAIRDYAQRRCTEQRRAADIGAYSFVHQLGYSSESIQAAEGRQRLVEQLADSLLTSQVDILYTHNPVDQHPTHQAVCQAVLAACLRIPPHARPKRIYGCELWGSLDWLSSSDKIGLDVSDHPQLARALNQCFQSQIESGKNYPEAVIGRRRANATFQDPYAADSVDQLWLAMDLSPLIAADASAHPDSLKHFVEEKLQAQHNKMLEALKLIA